MPPASQLVFFGTPEFAVPTLDALVAAGRTPLRVVTQPARPAGRGRRLTESAVALRAREHGLAVLTPERVRAPDFIAEMAALGPLEAAVVVAFGQIFPRPLLDLPRFGCINLHASLLPAYRGAAPIQAALAAGDVQTGVTTMRMEEGLDTGPILLQEATTVGAGETAGELAPRLAAIGGRLMVETLDRLARGELRPVAQDDARASYAPRLRRDSGRVDWSLPASVLHDRLRAYTPWPGLTAELAGEPLKIVRGRPLAAPTEAPPGTFLGEAQDGGLAIAAGAGSVFAAEAVQRPGKRPLAARDFRHGERLEPGDLFQ